MIFELGSQAGGGRGQHYYISWDLVDFTKVNVRDGNSQNFSASFLNDRGEMV
jgi:hypothetical protein